MDKKTFPSEEFFCQNCGSYCRDTGNNYEVKFCVECCENEEDNLCDCGLSSNNCFCPSKINMENNYDE